MEDLNKTQIILLCLLLSFVTSIATGIITASLLSEAPPVVTQTINRVVEQTIEQVAPAVGNTKEVRTVVVSVDDQVVEAIGKNSKSIIRIHSIGEDGTTKNFFGLGVVISDNGLLVAGLDGYNENTRYTTTLSDGLSYRLELVSKDTERELLFLKVVLGSGDKYTFSPTTLAKEDAKLGQTLVFVAGQERNTVTIARVSELVAADNTSTSSPIVRVGLDAMPKDPIVGLPLINLSGELIGLRVNVTFDSTTEGFIPISIIKAAIPKQ